jgi:hypothetical protein
LRISTAVGEVQVAGSITRFGTRAAAAILSAALFAPASVAQDAPAAAPTQTTAPQVAATAQGGTVKGTVIAGAVGKPGGVALPGVAVTATNTLTGKKFTTSTDVDGNYAMTLPKTGRYVIRAELMGFAAATQEIVIAAADAGTEKKAEFGLELASRAAAAAAQAETAQASGGQASSQRQAGAQGSRGQGARTLGGRGAVSLDLGDSGLGDASDASMAGANTGTNMPSMGGLGDANDATGGDAIAVSGGSQAQMNGLAGISEDELRNRVADAVAQARANGMLPQGGDPTNAIVGMLGPMMAGGGPGGGGFGGGGGGFGGGGGRGGRGGGGGGGAFRNLNPAQPHGSIFYQGSNNALNSAPWSQTLQPTTQPDGYQNNFGVTLGMSPYIPGLTKPNTKQFVFINLTGKKTLTAGVYEGIVPTAAERAGNFGGATIGSTNMPIVLYDPTTGAPFQNNIVPAARISQQALNLLNTGYYPLPNITPKVTGGDNYQTVTNAGNNNVALNARYIRTLGQATNTPFGRFGGGGSGGGRRGQNQNAPPQIHQNINLAYNYSHQAQDQRTLFLPLGGATESDGNNLNLGYTIGYGRLSNNASLTWNRLDAKTRNYFTDTANNPNATIGLNVPNASGGFADPRFYNGLAAFSFGKFTGLSNTTPSQTINQTISFTDFVAWRHKKHNMRFGLDYRRVHNDQIGGNNPLGSYDFSGYATESPADQAANDVNNTGNGFADFLLGLPQTTSIQAGPYKDYLRENVYDWYAQDDFRLAAGLTLSYGVRYEYFGPYTEKNNRLVNLTGINRTTPTTSGIGCVSPVALSYTTAAGTVNCAASGSASLVNGDHAMYAPRFGFAYRPNQKIKLFKDVVVRGGYGMNYNTGAFVSFAQSLSHQAPFAVTQTNTLTSGCTTTTTTTTANMTLANGFGCSNLYAITNNYAVDPNYRLGMTQVYNVNIQKTLPLQTVFNIGYNGTKAGNLDIYGTPNGNVNGSITPGIAPFDYETSGATLHSNQLVVSLQKRQQKGLAVGATYTYGHAIDDASAVGNGAARQPMQNFYNLRGEEGNSSLDVRHTVTGNWVAELPFGPNRKFLNKGGVAAKVLDGFSVSGTFTFATGTYLTPTYSGTQQANSGNTFTQRPDRDYSASSAGPGTVKEFFNTAAFGVPTGYGTAGVGSIEGPGTVSVTASLSRTLQFKGTNSLETRITASNVFNTVQYNSVTTDKFSASFGQVQSAASMRALQYQARYRF